MQVLIPAEIMFFFRLLHFSERGHGLCASRIDFILCVKADSPMFEEYGHAQTILRKNASVFRMNTKNMNYL